MDEIIIARLPFFFSLAVDFILFPLAHYCSAVIFYSYCHSTTQPGPAWLLRTLGRYVEAYLKIAYMVRPIRLIRRRQLRSETPDCRDVSDVSKILRQSFGL